MRNAWINELQATLRLQKEELQERLSRIRENHLRPPEADSKERAMQLENQEVVDALGNEAREELEFIASALSRIDSGDFANCAECGDKIGRERLQACPHAIKCIDCAELDAQHQRLAI